MAPEEFPHDGIFVAVFGDGQPLTENLEEQVPTGVLLGGSGYRRFDWFIKNKEQPRAGRRETALNGLWT